MSKVVKYIKLMRIIKSALLGLFVSLVVLRSVFLFYPLHHYIFVTFLQDSQYSQERQYLLAYFQQKTLLDLSLFNTNEVNHIQDLQLLFVSWRQIFIYVFLLFTLWQVIVIKNKGLNAWLIFFAKSLRQAAAMLPLLAVLGAIFFNPIFIFLHQIFFSGGNWLFDPATDLIIRLYPPQFFFYFMLLWLLMTELTIIILYFLLLFGIKKHRVRSPVL